VRSEGGSVDSGEGGASDGVDRHGGAEEVTVVGQRLGVETGGDRYGQSPGGR
jgi:hypothetical protein